MKTLPPQIEEIASFFGLFTALTMAKKLGGISFEIAKTKKNTNFEIIAEAIGEKKAEEFFRIFAGARIYIPKCESLFKESKKRHFLAVVKKYSATFPRYLAIRKAALICRISESRAKKWISEKNQIVL